MNKDRHPYRSVYHGLQLSRWYLSPVILIGIQVTLIVFDLIVRVAWWAIAILLVGLVYQFVYDTQRRAIRVQLRRIVTWRPREVAIRAELPNASFRNINIHETWNKDDFWEGVDAQTARIYAAIQFWLTKSDGSRNDDLTG